MLSRQESELNRVVLRLTQVIFGKSERQFFHSVDKFLSAHGRQGSFPKVQKFPSLPWMFVPLLLLSITPDPQISNIAWVLNDQEYYFALQIIDS